MKTMASMLLFLWLAIPAAAQDAPAPEKRSYSYLVYWRTARIGYQKSSWTTETVDGSRRDTISDETYIKIKRSFDGTTFEVRESSKKIYGPDWKPVSQSNERSDGGQKTTTEVKYSDKSISITEASGKGKPVNFEVSLEGKNFLDDQQAFAKLKAEGRLKAQERLSFDAFSSSDKALVPCIWIVGQATTRKAKTGEALKGTSISVVQGGARTELLLDDNGLPLWIWSSAMIAAERVNKIPEPFEVESPPEIKSSMEANAVIPGDDTQIERMEIHFKFPKDDGDGVPPLLDSNSYHDVVRWEKGKQTGYAARLKAQRLPDDFEAPAFPLANVDDSAKKFLAATPMCESEDEVLAGKSAELVKKCKDAREAATALCKFVYRHLAKKSGKSGTATARQAYDEKKGDCTEHAALFVAMARAAGLPARCVSGTVYLAGEEQAIWGYHAWSEVWLGRWVVVDATVNQVGVGARYLFFQYDEPGETEGSGRTARCLSNDFTPIIDAYRLKGRDEFRLEDSQKFEFK
ncbi:hypothetical protein PLCT2_02385 [Planctomycetaceae bacterium]|nr:hypothetical protein PLCT2_02385 [Planctomycetaceae bacterium]